MLDLGEDRVGPGDLTYLWINIAPLQKTMDTTFGWARLGLEVAANNIQYSNY